MKRHLSINPYLFSYLEFAMLCCIGFTTLFLYINLENMQRNEILHNEEKLSLIMDDFSNQMETLKDISLHLQVNSTYKPFYFQRNKYYELTLLEDFSQYSSLSPLLDEYILYYEDISVLFHSSAHTMDLNVWLKNFTEEESIEIYEQLTQLDKTTIYNSSANNIFIFYPLYSETISGDHTAVLCIIITSEALLERFQMISGTMNGEFALYANGEPIFNQNSSILTAEKNLLSATSADGELTLYYLPSAEKSFASSLLPLELLLILAVIILILFIASLFAYHSYKPILQLTQKYRAIIPENREESFKNELDALNHMTESLINTNLNAHTLLKQKQEQISTQLLLLLLNGKYTPHIESYFPSVGLTFSGPKYFVVSVQFEHKAMYDAHAWQSIKQQFESMSKPSEEKYIYSVLDIEHKIVHNLCSISEKIQLDEICDELQEFADNYEHSITIGCGSIYNNIGNLSASYLEALDNIHNPKSTAGHEPTYESSALRDQSILYQICAALTVTDEENALKALAKYVEQLKTEEPSLLMQQYLYTNFLSEINRLYREYHLEIPRQSISLIVSAKDIPQFSKAASYVIHEFCMQFKQQQSKLQENEAYRVLQYMNKNFCDYDISLEKVAQCTNTLPGFVRNVIKEHTGKSYVDYLIYLRLEYAKELLVKEQLSVAETCQKIGYSNVSYFIKVFKAHTGVTPANYKNVNQS